LVISWVSDTRKLPRVSKTLSLQSRTYCDGPEYVGTFHHSFITIITTSEQCSKPYGNLYSHLDRDSYDGLSSSLVHGGSVEPSWVIGLAAFDGQLKTIPQPARLRFWMLKWWIHRSQKRWMCFGVMEVTVLHAFFLPETSRLERSNAQQETIHTCTPTSPKD